MDKIRNEEVRRRAGIERELTSIWDQRLLRWFGHVERMDEYHMDRRVLMAAVCEGRVRGRPMLGSNPLDGWCESGLGKQRNDGGGCATMREKEKEWRALVHM